MPLRPDDRIIREKKLLQLNFPARNEGMPGLISDEAVARIFKDQQLRQEFSSRGFDLSKMTLVDADNTFSKFRLVERQPVLPTSDDFFVLFRFITRTAWEKKPGDRFPPFHPTGHHLAAIEAVMPNAGEILLKNPELVVQKTYDERAPLPDKKKVVSDLKAEFLQVSMMQRARNIISGADSALKIFNRRPKI